MQGSVDRRSLLAGFGVAAASSAAVAQAAPKAGIAKPAIGRGLPDVVVVGAGAMGGWTALVLRERGYKVTLVDAYGPGNPHASSGGETRNIRCAYGDRGLYSHWANLSWDLWHQRQAQFGRKLIYPSGMLWDGTPETLAAQAAVFGQYKIPYEMLPPQEVAKRWPGVRTDDIPMAFFDVHAGAVKARETSIAVWETFEQKGGKTRIGNVSLGEAAGGRLANVTLDGERLSGGEYVFAAGPWLRKLFPDLLAEKIRTPRAELFFIGPARGDSRYRHENCPAISDKHTYTTADIGGGYKIAAATGEVVMDPDDDERLPSHYLLRKVEEYVKIRLPGLVGRPIIQGYVCQTEHTANGHFIIDRHPDYANALIAGGGSGHAFKMGPFLGPYLADRLAGAPQDSVEREMFSIASHTSAFAARPRRASESL